MRKLSLGFSFVAMAVLAACGDGSGTNANSNLLGNSSNSTSESDDEYDSIVAEVDNLPKCTEEKDGEVYYVKEDGVAYTCRYDGEEESGEWVRKKKNVDDDQKSSSSVKKADVSSSSGESANEYDGEVEEFDDLPKCTAKKDGKVYYVEDEDVTYTCKYDEDEEAGEWVSKKKKPSDDDQESSSSANGDDDSSSSEESSSSSSISLSSSDASIYDATANTLTDLRDGQVYRTTIIAPEGTDYSEVWMAENLNYVTSNSYCYNDTTVSCDAYGRLYTWPAAVGKTEDECGYGHECGLSTGDVRGVCPKGWHVPSQSEWNELLTAVGGLSTAGTKLKSTSGWNSSGNGTDNYVFSALPAGIRINLGSYYNEGNDADFWSSTEIDSWTVYYLYMYDYEDNAYLNNIDKNYGFSVRCLKD